ncbi:hypothetical protein D0N36_14290 [Hymenobacter lapidiphilus]|uniref:AAA family ATPase n=1 Tax=Hymenobacter sp. CCM 8763 TaxID=2303334 RepID=UPI000E356B23|nr:AAA family ATPase [Hymenobacter sp. CCM 8763]RFP64355.1 hypothetical protein D0N36_14290 [Hymenobacter sp. CCM 8763]
MQQLAVDNFRVFASPANFELSPITILTGRNNAGKSSLIKSLLLLADYLEQDDQTVLRLDGPRARRHKISQFNNLKNWETAADTVSLSYTVGGIRLEYEFGRHQEPVMARLLRFRVVAPALNEYLELRLIGTEHTTYKLSVRQALIDFLIKEDAYLAAQSLGYLAEANKVREKLDNLDKEIESKTAQFEKSPEMLKFLAVASAFEQLNGRRGKLLAQIDELKASAESSRTRDKGITYSANVTPDELEPGSASLPRLIQAGLLSYLDDDATRPVQFFKYRAEQERHTLVRFYQGLQLALRFPLVHLGPNRTYQSRLYFSHQGSSEIMAIVEAFMHRGIRPGSEADQFLRHWLPRFNVGDSVNVTPVEGMAFKITINPTSRRGNPINLADLGFGAGQILTILLQIASVVQQQEERRKAVKSTDSPPVLLLIEEPEANLHPRLQSLLAVLFEEVTQRYHIRLLVETHSEYVVRKLQLLVATRPVNDGLPPLPGAVIYYMDQRLEPTSDEPEKLVAVARRITILPDGKLSEAFGEGFFDEADEHAMELYRLQKKAARQAADRLS